MKGGETAAGDDSDDDMNELNNDDLTSRWGGKKSVYWNADTADLEIGQDFQDAEDEEEAAKVLLYLT